MIDYRYSNMLTISRRTDEDAVSPGERIDPHTASGVVIAVESADCFCFAFETQEMRSLSSRNLLVYELEDFVPGNGDELAVDTLRSRQGTLVVAIDSKRFVEPISTLDEAGTFVHAISPKVMLAIQSLGRATKLKTFDWVFWKTDDQIDAVRLTTGKPVQWAWMRCEPVEVRRLLTADELAKRVLAVNLSPDFFADMDEGISVECLEKELNEASNETCERIVQGVERPYFDLRDGQLKPRQPHKPISLALGGVVGAFLVLQVLIAVTAYMKADQYRQLTTEVIADQERAYQSVFPNQPVPVGMVSRLESEERRLLGTRGLSGNDSPQVGSIIPAAHKFLSALPFEGDARFQLDRIEMVPGAVASVIGEANSFETVDVIGRRLRDAGFDVPPASSSQKGEGVSLRLEGITIAEPEESP